MSEKQRIVDGRVKYIETCLRGMRKIQPKLSKSQDEMFRVYKNDIMRMVKLITKGECPTCEAFRITRNVKDQTKH